MTRQICCLNRNNAAEISGHDDNLRGCRTPRAVGKAERVSIEEPNDVPEVWRPYFRSQRIEFTFRDLDRNVEGVALNTIRRALLGIGDPSRRVVAAIAEALALTPEQFSAIRSKVNGAEPTAPFVLPTRADLLNQRERAAVVEIVNALLDARERDNAVEATTQSDAPSEAGPNKKIGAGDPRDPDDYDLAGRDTGDISEGEAIRRQQERTAEQGGA